MALSILFLISLELLQAQRHSFVTMIFFWPGSSGLTGYFISFGKR
jgi:hypothetical protein